MNGRPSSSTKFFDELASEWSAHYVRDPRFVRRMHRIEALLRSAAPHRFGSGRALDAGCGSGVFSRLLDRLGWSVTAFDQSPGMVEAAREATTPNVQFEVADLSTFRPENSFALIVSLSVLEYVADEAQALAHLTSWLEPGGILILSVPNASGLLRKLESAAAWISRVSGGRVFRGRGKYLEFQRRQYRPVELDRRMRSLGFRKERALFLNASVTRPPVLMPLLERQWWAAMYCAVYRKEDSAGA